MKSPVIYTVTVVATHNHDSRTWGWFPNFDQAEEAVLMNFGEMFEFYYDYAVIQALPAGIMSRRISESWYVAKYRKDDTYPVIARTLKPESLKSLMFGIG